jgi:hypothetical protein
MVAQTRTTASVHASPGLVQFTRFEVENIVFSLKPETRRELDRPHRPHGDYTAERRRIQRSIDRSVLRGIKYVRHLRSNFQGPRLSQRKDFSKRHIKQE